MGETFEAYRETVQMSGMAVCRFCIQSSGPMRIIPFSELPYSPISAFFYEVTKIRLDVSGEYPEYICTECEHILQVSAGHIRKFREVDAFWKRYLFNFQEIPVNMVEADGKPMAMGDMKMEAEEYLIEYDDGGDMDLDGPKFQTYFLDESRGSDAEVADEEMEQSTTSDVKNNIVSSLKLSKPTGLQCDLCSKTGYKTRKSMLGHLKECIQRRQHVCLICGRGFKDQDKLEIHSKSHIKYQCGECNFECKNQLALDSHSQMHGEHVCEQCGRTFKNNKNLLYHLRKFHVEMLNKGPFTCKECRAVFDDKEDFRDHVRTNHMVESICPKCEKVCVSSVHLRKHMLKRHNEKLRVKCNHCDKSFANKYILRQHMDMHFPNENSQPKPSHMCDICGREFKSLTSVTRHVKLHETDPEIAMKARAPAGSGKFACPLCDARHVRCGPLRQHMKQDHPIEGPQLWEQLVVRMCLKCNIEFPTEDELRLHRDTHNDFQCSVCRQSMTSEESLKYHMLTHSGKERPHKCEICEATYIKSAHLAQHIRRAHIKERPHKCRLCPKDFVESYELIKHIRFVHEQVRNYVCEVCNKSFKKGTELKIHAQKHTGIYKYRCEICNRNFGNSSKYAGHNAAKHPHMQPQAQMMSVEYELKGLVHKTEIVIDDY